METEVKSNTRSKRVGRLELRAQSVTLTRPQIDWLYVYGYGNVSAGIRRLVDEKKKEERGR